MTTRVWTGLGALLAAAAAAALWLFPSVYFGNPGPNDAIRLSSYGPLLLALVIGLSLLSLVVVGTRRWPAAVPISLGLLDVGAGLTMVLGLVVFGNMSNDRYAPLLFLPWLVAPVGLAVFAGGLVLRRRFPGELLPTYLRSGIAIAVVAVWLLARGSREWLLAPYGFDWFALVALAAVVLTVVEYGADTHRFARRIRPRMG